MSCRGRCPQRPASGQRPPLQYTQHPFILCRRARRPGAPLKVCLLPVPWSRLPEKDGGYFAPGRGTFQGWKVPKDPRAVVLTKYASLGTPRRGHSSYAPLLVLSQPRPLRWVVVGFPGLRPYDFRTRGARLENGLNLFGAGMNLGPLHLPPAAARIYQIHVSPLFPLAPFVRLAFSVP